MFARGLQSSDLSALDILRVLIGFPSPSPFLMGFEPRCTECHAQWVCVQTELPGDVLDGEHISLPAYASESSDGWCT